MLLRAQAGPSGFMGIVMLAMLSFVVHDVAGAWICCMEPHCLLISCLPVAFSSAVAKLLLLSC